MRKLFQSYDLRRRKRISFPSFKDAEEFFELPKILSSLVRRGRNVVTDKNKERFLKIIEHNGKIIPVSAKSQPVFQRRWNGPKFYFPNVGKLSESQRKHSGGVIRFGTLREENAEVFK